MLHSTDVTARSCSGVNSPRSRRTESFPKPTTTSIGLGELKCSSTSESSCEGKGVGVPVRLHRVSHQRVVVRKHKRPTVSAFHVEADRLAAAASRNGAVRTSCPPRGRSSRGRSGASPRESRPANRQATTRRRRRRRWACPPRRLYPLRSRSRLGRCDAIRGSGLRRPRDLRRCRRRRRHL